MDPIINILKSLSKCNFSGPNIEKGSYSVHIRSPSKYRLQLAIDYLLFLTILGRYDNLNHQPVK